jgi:MATE family multidrug resistance protein
MHRKVWQLAGPIILANITVPLLGAVNIAVVGHIPGPQYMAAVGIGATIFSVLYFGFVFLRMGTTGLVSISKGSQDEHECIAWLLRALILAILIGLILYALKIPIVELCQYLIDPPEKSAPLVEEYFYVRITSAPAALANFAFLGWMIGMQKAKQALYVQLILNMTNIVLNIYFVMGLGFGVKGVAYGTVIAEYVGLGFALFVVRQYLINFFAHENNFRVLLNTKKLIALCSINVNIFIRSLGLQVAFFYFTTKGAQFGDTILAVNAVLMNFQLFMAYALDGFANAAEALTGESIGKKHKRYFYDSFKSTTFWAFVFACFFTLSYALLWKPIVYLLTDVEVVREAMSDYVTWAILLPLVSVWSFQLDGIFTGATVTGPMRDSMIVSLIIFILLTLWLLPIMGNHGLWCAFFGFMIARAITLGIAWPMLMKRFQWN